MEVGHAGFERVRAGCWSIDDEEEEIGARCVGVPVFDQNGNWVGTVSVAGTTERVHPDNLEKLADQVRKTAAQISQHIGSCSKEAQEPN